MVLGGSPGRGVTAMRIGIAAFMHESNTFAGTKTDHRHFEEAHLDVGPDLVPVWSHAHHELGGFIEGCADAEMVPLLAAWATPGGPLTTTAYESLVGALLDAIDHAGHLDGILLALHGAMTSESHRDADGETLERLRHKFGNERPIVVTLDMHGNVSPRMARLATAIVAYQTYPHIDQRARGLEAAALMTHLLQTHRQPVTAHVKLPLLIHITRQYTGGGPMADLYAETARVRQKPGVLAVSLLPGYIYADTPYMGVSVLVTAESPETATNEAEALGARVFEKRDELNAALPTAETAVQQAIATPGTVCLMDGGDNIGAGGPGDSTVLLHELLKQRAESVCAILLDTEAVAACRAAGVGGHVTLEVGGKSGPQHGAPVSVEGTVRVLHDGVYIEEEARHGGMRQANQGPAAVIETNEGHCIVVNSLRVMPTSLAQLTSLALDPSSFRCIIVKGVTAPLAAYGPIASRVIPVDTPGVTRAGPDAFSYAHRPVPIYPLENDFEWTPRATLNANEIQ